MRQIKKVLCSVVLTEGNRLFEEILLDESLRYVLPYKNKSIELSHVVDEGEIITGMFVATQTKDIAPIHTPGDEDDYSAVSLEEGKGFAYPNIFLYSKNTKVLCWEVNRSGLLESGMEYYFNSISEVYSGNSYHVSIVPLMNLEASQRLNRLFEINSIELQIAAPTEYLTQEAGNNGAISDLYKVVNETNATKCVSIKLTAEEARLNKLDRSGVRNLVNGFLRIPQGYHGRTKNKLIVVGKSGDDD